MFLEKLRKITQDWKLTNDQFKVFAAESFLYGMRINKSPNNLKRFVKNLKLYEIDTTIATKQIKGNSYLLHTLPRSLVEKKAKIPNLKDFLFARSLLKEGDMAVLQNRVQKLKQVNIQDLYISGSIQPLIQRYSSKGSFFSKYDRMYESTVDFKQAVALEALVLLNTEFDKLTAYDEETVGRYVNTCLGKKAKSLVSAGVTKSFKTEKEVSREYIAPVKILRKNSSQEVLSPAEVRTQTHKKTVSIFQDFEDAEIAENVSYCSDSSDEFYEDALNNFEIRHDLSKLLKGNLFDGLAIYCGFASPELIQDFENFLTDKGLKSDSLSDYKRKKQIELYFKEPIFERIKENAQFKEYFKSA